MRGWTRRDAAACGAIVALAAALRFWGLWRLGLTHFDEGTYALTARWLVTLGREGTPYNAILAPPLFPILEGVAFLVLGVRDWAGIAVSAVAGSLTVGLLFSIGLKWFGPAVGAAAALLLAVAQYHVVYSRLGLTDATFTLLFWAALAFAFEAMRDASTRLYVVAGVLTGLCWNTKYNGFLPLAIAIGWSFLARFETVTREPSLRVATRDLALSVAIAVAMYLPLAAVVQIQSGYGALLRWHANHTLGAGLLPTPPSTIWFYFSHWLSPVTLAAAGVGIVRIWYRRTRAGTLLLTTFAVFGTLAMLYMSFPRLVLPLVPALCLLAAVGLDAFARAVSQARRAQVLAIATALALAWGLPGTLRCVMLRTDVYRQAAAYVRKSGLPVVSQASRCYYFYESAPSLEMRFHDVARLDAALASSPEVLVVVDPIVERLPEPKAWFERTCAGLEPERIFPITAYEPVYYQGFDPYLAFDRVPRSVAPFVPGEAAIRVFRVRR